MLMFTRSHQRVLSSSRSIPRATCRNHALCHIPLARAMHLDHRVRMQNHFMPSGSVSVKDRKADEDGHAKLVRAGFIRQAHAGLFHLMPLGFRVQEKIKALVDKHMGSIGASRVSLSTISSPTLWEKSGRYGKVGSELFQFLDRREMPYLLSPTHEEEITSVVRKSVVSYKTLPLRLYQITRKYRDEARPRKGLLRSREFVMKDLYTFDVTVKDALVTYNEVRAAYDRLFAELRLPILVAEASSGDIGGDLSHEYHLATSHGEDGVITCGTCGYTANCEVAEAPLPRQRDPGAAKPAVSDVRVWRGISKDRRTLVNVWYAGHAGNTRDYERVNVHAVKRAVPELDTSIDNAIPSWWDALHQSRKAEGVSGEPNADARPEALSFINLVDGSVAHLSVQSLAQGELNSAVLPSSKESAAEVSMPSPVFVSHDQSGELFRLLHIRDGDPCPKCDSGTLKVQQAIELAHTFHLGDRYSKPMRFEIDAPQSVAGSQESGPPDSSVENPTRAHVQMGCHGIGVSRIIGAVAEHLSDDRGLNWPRAIAPYEVAVLAHKGLEEDAVQMYDLLAATASPSGAPLDLVLDDRDKRLPWKLMDADLMGYPVIVVVGNEWNKSRQCEVQCRQLGVKQYVAADELCSVVNGLLEQL